VLFVSLVEVHYSCLRLTVVVTHRTTVGDVKLIDDRVSM
jgi:hypothetical protein